MKENILWFCYYYPRHTVDRRSGGQQPRDVHMRNIITLRVGIGSHVIRSFAYSVGQFQYVVLAFITSRCRNQVGPEGWRRRAFECELMNWEMTGGFPMARTWNNRQLVHFAGRIPPFSVRPSVSESEDGMVSLKPNYDVIRFGNFSSLTRNRGEERRAEGGRRSRDERRRRRRDVVNLNLQSYNLCSLLG